MQLFDLFHQFRSILCVCPGCNKIVRLSDLSLRTVVEAPTTWLDKYNKKLQRLEKRIEKFDEKEEQIREKAREKGRKIAIKETRKALDACISKCGYSPRDIKSLLHPVDFVVFDGLDLKDQADQVVFLSKMTRYPPITRLRKTVRKTIEKENYNWQLLRIKDDGTMETE